MIMAVTDEIYIQHGTHIYIYDYLTRFFKGYSNSGFLPRSVLNSEQNGIALLTDRSNKPIDMMIYIDGHFRKFQLNPNVTLPDLHSHLTSLYGYEMFLTRVYEEGFTLRTYVFHPKLHALGGII